MCCFWQLVPVSLANISCFKAWCFLTQKPTSNSQFEEKTSGFFGRLGIRLEKRSQDGIRAPSGDSGFHVIFHHFSPCTLGVSYPALPVAKKNDWKYYNYTAWWHIPLPSRQNLESARRILHVWFACMKLREEAPETKWINSTNGMKQLTASTRKSW